MRVSRYYLPTLKEAPKEAELASHIFLVRGGFIRQLAAGIYDFLPLGVRVLRKVSNIIREEMDRHGGIEVALPAVQPSELWKESGRWDYYGAELLRFRDRHDREFCFGPTHEEVITDLVRRDVRSYRDLPVNLYQIHVKFRDEVKPRGGLMRAREFIMKDAYSFDVDIEGAKRSYQAMYNAYCAIFRRCGLDFRVVEADTGKIGGSMSHEFQVVADTGEDYVLRCEKCDLTVTQEMAMARVIEPVSADPSVPPIEPVYTPGVRSVEEVAAFLKVTPLQVMKTLICVVDGQPIAVMLRGDRELSDVKLRRSLAAAKVELATDDVVEEITGASVGFAGPVGLKKKVPVYADHEIAAIGSGVAGANRDDYHLRNVVPGRDFEIERFIDVHLVQPGDRCPNCAEGTYSLFRGIEVGHIFFLGTKYSHAMQCTFLDEQGKPQPAVMGCYGIGVTRLISAAVEQNHDERGIIWPLAIAPFQVALLGLQMKDPRVVEACENLYTDLANRGVEVLFDDRDIRPGVKFNDADLVGYPFQLIVGARDLAEGLVELKTRRTEEREKLPIASAADMVAAKCG